MSLLDAAGVVTSDIWCNGAFSFESPLKDLLDTGEYTLEQLLAEDELLQELRGVHPELIAFFSSPSSVAKLTKYIILASSDDSQLPAQLPKIENLAPMIEEQDDHVNGTRANQARKDEVHVRYPYMACEVICCEIAGVLDILVEGHVPQENDPDQSFKSIEIDATPNDETGDAGEASKEEKDGTEGEDEQKPKEEEGERILDVLFSLLYNSKPGEIDDYRAGYFDKILSVLFRKYPSELSEYINNGGRRGQEDLMRVMFQHLYSHSIMQIIQRLLMPMPPQFPETENETGEEVDEENKDEVDRDPLENAQLDPDGLGAFRCNWSESELALELLLKCLIWPTSPYPEIKDDEERMLSMNQNASEVLITIIQNSPMTSPILHELTEDPILEKLIRAACVVNPGDEFSPHDSRLTCTMNVLESLILQLGGYGSVGAILYAEGEEGAIIGYDEEGNPVTNADAGTMAQSNASQSLATTAALIRHLPMMLSSLSTLLLYPGASEWTSPMQFAEKSPQRILGSSRLRIVRLLESLVLLGDPQVDTLLCESTCLEICLDLFWEFKWCSMLHQSVANLLVHIFEGQNVRGELQTFFLVKCNLIGRLMASFVDNDDTRSRLLQQQQESSDTRLSDAINAMKSESGQQGVATSSVQSEMGSTQDSGNGEVLPVSDDDVDAALEQEEKEAEDRNETDVGEPASATADEHRLPQQALRLGYMGHIIIICQALVHACSNDPDGPSVDGASYDGQELVPSDTDQGVDKYASTEELAASSGDDQTPKTTAADGVFLDGDNPLNPLILASLVESHPLRDEWHDFVSTTLASETAIQSTPLGGFPGDGMGGMDGGVLLHRPGLAEDDDYADEDGAAPPLPPRGLLVGDDALDMDDNDLEEAANMMAGMSLGQGTGGRNHQDFLAGIPNTSGPASYGFDDPLGSDRFAQFDNDGDSSSDEESEMSGNTPDSGDAVQEGFQNDPDPNISDSGGAPVMDLFAGNFESFDDQPSDGKAAESRWSDFANFDDAFAGADPVQDTGVSRPEPSEEEPPTNTVVDDVFGTVKDHASLLDDIPIDTAIPVVKTNSSEGNDDSSSDEEDPVPEEDDREAEKEKESS